MKGILADRSALTACEEIHDFFSAEGGGGHDRKWPNEYSSI
jgi:hypothetical protein